MERKENMGTVKLHFSTCTIYTVSNYYIQMKVLMKITQKSLYQTSSYKGKGPITLSVGLTLYLTNSIICLVVPNVGIWYCFCNFYHRHQGKCFLWTSSVSRREAHSFDILHANSCEGRRDVIKEGKSTHRTTGAVGVLLHCQLSCNCKMLILWPPLHHLLLAQLSQGWWLLMGKHTSNSHKINFLEHRWRSQCYLYTYCTRMARWPGLKELALALKAKVNSPHSPQHGCGWAADSPGLWRSHIFPLLGGKAISTTWSLTSSGESGNLHACLIRINLSPGIFLIVKYKTECQRSDYQHFIPLLT